MRFLGRPLKALRLHATEEALTDNYIKVRLTNPDAARDVVSVQIDAISDLQTLGSVICV
jgi:hypothetical protein